MPDALRQQLSLLPEYLSAHLLLCVMALAIGIGLSLPLAFVTLRVRRLQGPVLIIASAIQTIPGLALLALMVPLLGRIGFVPALIALVLYSVLPVLRNTVTGIEEVDANLIEAGRGLGMTPNQLLIRVQLPLAAPVIVAGIRTATVWVVGIATLSTPVGATSLGNYIFSGLQTQNYAAVSVGCIAAAVLALVLDRLVRFIEIAMTRRSRPRAAVAGGLTIAILGFGLWPALFSGSLQDERLIAVIGTKTFTEQYILGALISEELDMAGFETRTLDSLGSTVAFDALAAGQIDAYVDYTGTIWANYMRREGNPGRDEIAIQVDQWLDNEHGIDVVARFDFENAYALAVTRANAESWRAQTIGDLVARAPELTIGGDYEFFGRPEWLDLSTRYGLQFGEQVTMDSTLMYAAVAEGDVDVISAFSTDGRIDAFELVVLDDVRAALPPYDAVLLVSPGLQQRKPEIYRALAVFDGAIDVDAMRSANRSVDLDGGTILDAARALSERISR